MGGPRLQQDETRTMELSTTIPRVSDAVVRDRANAAFDNAMRTLLTGSFTRPPPAAEIKGLNDLIRANPSWKDSNGNLDLDRVVRTYSENNPESTIARYYDATGTPNWLVTGGRIGFNRSVLQAEVRDALLAVKKPFTETAIWLNGDPKRRSKDLQVAQQLAGPMPEFSSHLSKQIESGRNSIPFAVAYNQETTELSVASKLKPEREDFNPAP